MGLEATGYGAIELDDLKWIDTEGGHSYAEVILSRGQSIENPASTRRRIYGPAKIRFDRHADGGIDARVSELTE